MKLLHPAALFLTFVLTAGSAVAFAAPDLTEALKKTVAVQLPIFINSIKRIPPIMSILILPDEVSRLIASPFPLPDASAGDGIYLRPGSGTYGR